MTLLLFVLAILLVLALFVLVVVMEARVFDASPDLPHHRQWHRRNRVRA